ncbi:MAG TPA: flagellar basal body rod protein FlgB [Terriglobales bacterium]|nr:flagellar basal body rod protein FlgB [Terriglobales bacterium]
MNLVDTPMMHTLSRALDLTSQRQSLVSQNVANIDTPGYKARDIDFRQELQRALGEDEGPQAATLVREVPGLIERPDGNNVSLDRESLLMAQNQLAFQVDVQLLRAEFNRLQLAINGGSGQ